MALCNMAVEAGAKTGIFEADDKALEYLKEHGREPKAVYHSDPDAVYAREYTFDLSKVRPVVAKPDFVDNVVPAEETCGIKINEAFLGSCNNGRIEDLRVGAEVIKGKKSCRGSSFPGCSCKPDHLSSGIKGGAYRYLHGSRGYCYEPELQCMLGKLPGCYRRE